MYAIIKLDLPENIGTMPNILQWIISRLELYVQFKLIRMNFLHFIWLANTILT